MREELSELGRQFLGQKLFAVLATKRKDGSVLQCYMWYKLMKDRINGDTILINTTKERPQYHNVLNNPYVSLCIGERYEYIRVEGNCRIVDNKQTALKDILLLATRYDGAEAALWYFNTILVNENRVSFYIKIEKVYEYWGIDNRKIIGEFL